MKSYIITTYICLLALSLHGCIAPSAQFRWFDPRSGQAKDWKKKKKKKRKTPVASLVNVHHLNINCW